MDAWVRKTRDRADQQASASWYGAKATKGLYYLLHAPLVLCMGCTTYVATMAASLPPDDPKQADYLLASAILAAVSTVISVAATGIDAQSLSQKSHAAYLAFRAVADRADRALALEDFEGLETLADDFRKAREEQPLLLCCWCWCCRTGPPARP